MRIARNAWLYNSRTAASATHAATRSAGALCCGAPTQESLSRPRMKCWCLRGRCTGTRAERTCTNSLSRMSHLRSAARDRLPRRRRHLLCKGLPWKHVSSLEEEPPLPAVAALISANQGARKARGHSLPLVPSREVQLNCHCHRRRRCHHLRALDSH